MAQVMSTDIPAQETAIRPIRAASSWRALISATERICIEHYLPVGLEVGSQKYIFRSKKYQILTAEVFMQTRRLTRKAQDRLNEYAVRTGQTTSGRGEAKRSALL
jgi:hypothetical protein